MRHVVRVWVFAVAVGCVSAASGQSYPIRPIRLLTAGAAGGSDITARLIAQGLSEKLGQPVVVDTRVGGVIIAETAAKAQPDGYTLLVYSGTLWLLPLMQEKPTYDALRDFSPITFIGSSPMVLVVHPSVPAKSVQELIALAKAKPAELNCATGPRGATPHLAAELFKSLAGIDIVQVAYRSVGAGVTDVLGGRVQMMFPNAGAVMAHIKAGRLRALGSGSPRPSALAPGLPTIAESGLPGYEGVATYGMFAPAKMPAALLKRLNDEAVRVLQSPEVKEKLFNSSIEVIGSSPEGLRTQMQSDVAKLGKVIKAAKIRID
ncbi:MAG TPA: tripartite tricarboxylate transporter substrate binding protein [Burkholderiales bacterium]|jgi:tripartite-type tricarboxylate transporter receptor subunit TctC|nr:tripartite tricarboxylate transporter substrate binding protein [Burkholderiales bacterium]